MEIHFFMRELTFKVIVVMLLCNVFNFIIVSNYSNCKSFTTEELDIWIYCDQTPEKLLKSFRINQITFERTDSHFKKVSYPLHSHFSRYIKLSWKIYMWKKNKWNLTSKIETNLFFEPNQEWNKWEILSLIWFVKNVLIY